MIHVSSVNSKKREDSSPIAGDGVFAGEKRLYTFQEKVASMQGSDSAPKQLRNVTRIDPLTYLLFGASHMRVLENGLGKSKGDVRFSRISLIFIFPKYRGGRLATDHGQPRRSRRHPEIANRDRQLFLASLGRSRPLEPGQDARCAQ